MDELYFAADKLLDAVSKFTFKVKQEDDSRVGPEWDDAMLAFQRCQKLIDQVSETDKTQAILNAVNMELVKLEQPVIPMIIAERIKLKLKETFNLVGRVW